MLAIQTQEIYPGKLAGICTRINEAAETAALSPACDIRQFVTAQMRRSLTPLNLVANV